MACIINADNGAISGSAGVKTTADSTGVLNIQTNGTTAISISASQAVSFTNTPTFTGGTANGVLYLNGSKVATSGSALTFDGTNLAVGASPTFYGAQVATAGSISITGGNLLKLWNTGGTGVGGISSPGTDTIAFGLGASFTEGMRLTSTGLGIGTTSPAFRLDVLTGVEGDSVRLNNNNTNIGAANTFGFVVAESGSARVNLRYRRDGTGAAELYNVTNGPFIFGTNNTERMRLDSSGNLGIGTSLPAVKLQVKSSAEAFRIEGTTARGSGNIFASFHDPSGRKGYWGYGDSSDNYYISNEMNAAMLFITNAVERARITSGGDLLVGTTSQLYGERFNVTRGGAGTNCATFYFNTSDDRAAEIIRHARASGATQASMIAFLDSGGTERGTIKTDGSATAYNTSSDRRLKENIASADEASSVIDAIKIVKHNWKSGGHVRFGVIAQDLHQVAPEAVSAGDDGEEIEKTWGVDYSKLVPMLVKEIQSLRARVAQLETK